MVDHSLAASRLGQLLAHPTAKARFAWFRLGEIECLALGDGGIPMVPMPEQARPPRQAVTDLAVLPGLTQLSCLLVRLPGNGPTVLIDTGFGTHASRRGCSLPTVGRLLESLANAGLTPVNIDVVLISHIHPDHIGGMFDLAGAKIFPNADYFAPAAEVAFWGQEVIDLSFSPISLPLKEEILGASRRMLNIAGDRLRTFLAGEDAIPGIRTIALPGHTPGQVGFVISSGNETLLYTADAVTKAIDSIETPERYFVNDLEPDLAVKTRQRLLAMLSREGWRSFVPHFPWPSHGYVRTTDGHSVWEPST